MSEAILPDLEKLEARAIADEEALFLKLQSRLQSAFRDLGAHRAEAMVLHYNGKPVPAELSNAYEDGLTKVSSIIGRSMAFADLLGRIRVIRNAKKEAKKAGGEIKAYAAFKHQAGKVFYAGIVDALPDFLTLPFQEAIELFAEREPILVDKAATIENAYKRQQFAIKKSINIQFTKTVQKSIGKVLRGHEDLGDFIDRFRKEGLSDGYAETVFRTNLKTANMAGRVAQAKDPDLGGFIVAFRYSTAGDTDTRSTHQEMDGFSAAVDAAIWRTWTPPAGWNCRCSLIEVTRPQAKKLGRLDEDGKFVDSAPRNVSPDKGFQSSPVSRIYG